MRAVGILLIGTWLLAGCSQVIDQFYSKKNFNMQSFNAESIDDAMVRECMKAKGYTVQIETK
jgi:hypothetical protein